MSILRVGADLLHVDEQTGRTDSLTDNGEANSRFFRNCANAPKSDQRKDNHSSHKNQPERIR